MASKAQPSVLTDLNDALLLVQEKKAALDAKAAEVEAASAAHQEAVAAATKLHDQFTAHIDGVLPTARSR